MKLLRKMTTFFNLTLDSATDNTKEDFCTTYGSDSLYYNSKK